MKKFLNIRALWRMLMILSYLMMSYYYFDGWWNAGLGTLLILLFAYLLWPDEFLVRTGFKISTGQIILTLILVVLLTPGAYWLMKAIANIGGIIIQYTTWKNFVHILFYTLNEEIILGAVLLGLITRRFPAIPRPAVSVLVALAFSILHYIFYRWIFLEKGILSYLSLLSLSAVGILRNNLILGTGHIGYSWALHASWIAIMLGCIHRDGINGELVADHERFNLYLESPVTFTIISALAAISFVLYLKKRGVIHS